MMKENNNPFSKIIKGIFEDEDSMVRSIGKFSLLFMIIGIPFCLIFYGLYGMIIFLVCSVLMLLNLGWLKELVDIITIKSDKKKTGFKGFAGFFVLYLLLGISLYVIISLRGMEVVPLLLGISTLVFGTFCVSLKELFRRSK